MIKQTLLAGATALVLTAMVPAAANANTGYGTASNSGLYLGLGAGYTWGDDGAGLGIDPDGWEGGVFGGYRHGFNDMFALGAEAGVDFVNNVEEDAAGAKIDKRNSYYVELQPVFTFARDWNVFGSAGWQWAQYKGTVLGVTDTQTYDGFRYGGGIEYAYWQRTGVRAQLTQVEYDQEGPFEPEETNLRVGVFHKF